MVAIGSIFRKWRERRERAKQIDSWYAQVIVARQNLCERLDQIIDDKHPGLDMKDRYRVSTHRTLNMMGAAMNRLIVPAAPVAS